MAGVAWLTRDLGADTLLAVEIAFGADLTDVDGSSWVWVDVTEDVRVADGINIKVGKSDEASSSQPASCELTLDNSSGDYSIGGMSQYWPHVRTNTPVRVTIDSAGSGAAVAFQGYANGFSPVWDTSASIPRVKLSASGVMRRLAQGDAPVMSPMRRVILNSPDLIAYWPLEDGPNAQNFAAAVGPNAMTFYSEEHPGGNAGANAVPPDIAASSDFICSDPLPKLAGSELYGHVGGYDGSAGECQVRMLVDFQSATDETVILGLATTGSSNISVSSDLWEVRNKSANVLNVRGWARGVMIVDQNIMFTQDSTRGQLGLQLVQNGANIDWRIDYLEEGASSGGFYTATVNNYTFGNVARVQINTDGGNANVVVGHVALYNQINDIFDNVDELNAYDNENVIDSGANEGRLSRLTGDYGIPLTVYGDPVTPYEIDDLGPQGRDNMVNLLDEAAKVEHGILWDGRDLGLSYTGRRAREARPADLVIDAAALEILPPFQPINDDAGTRNRVTAKRDGGGFWTHEDTDGPKGVDEIGLYDDSQTYNCRLDESLSHFASWAVAAGTIEGYRFPELSVDVGTISDRAEAILGLIPGARVDITNLADIRSDIPDADIRLALEGWTMRLDSHRWILTMNLSPYAVWAVGVLEDDVGDPSVAGEFPLRLDTDGSTLASSVSAGATSMSVARTDSTTPLWTTSSSDMPIKLDVGGLPVTASAISGSSSPQTFTVSALPKAFAAGTPVKLWDPIRIAI